MILNNIKIGDRVNHECFGMGTVTGFDTKKGYYENWLLVQFDDPRRPGLHVLSPRRMWDKIKDVKT